MKTETVSAELIAKTSRRTNVLALIGRVFNVCAAEVKNSGTHIMYDYKDRYPRCSITDFLNFYFFKKPLDSTVTISTDAAIGISYLEQAIDMMPEGQFLSAVRELQIYGEQYYAGKSQVIMADNNALIFLVELPADEYDYVREEYFMSVLSGTNLCKTLRDAVINNTPFVTQNTETL